METKDLKQNFVCIICFRIPTPTFALLLHTPTPLSVMARDPQIYLLFHFQISQLTSQNVLIGVNGYFCIIFS